MSNDNEPHTSPSRAVIAIVAAVVFLLMGGVLVLGIAGWFFFRVSRVEQVRFAEEQRFIAEHDRAVAEAKKPTELAHEGQAQSTAEVSPPVASVRKMTIRLDSQGKIVAGGQAVEHCLRGRGLPGSRCCGSLRVLRGLA
jgi:hypothetical protein